jgi:uncharacterized protein YndB with AHSA1/START domain
MTMPAKQSPATRASVHVVELEVTIQAPIERVWKALVTETGRWWRKDFYADAAGRDFIIEPVLGGKMYEDWGDGEGLVWATVTGVRAPTLLELSGVSSPKWGGPNTHYHSFRLEEQGGATVLHFSDAVHGKIDDATATSLHEGWLLLFNEALRTHCELEPERKRRR